MAVEKLLLLASFLAKDGVLTANSKAFFKELILRRDHRLQALLERFQRPQMNDAVLDEVHALVADEAQRHFERIFAHCSLDEAKILSKTERELRGQLQQKSLIYGEVDFRSFLAVLRRVPLQPGGIFYDLGSGTGRALFVARLTHDFARCVGIELLSGLHASGRRAERRFRRFVLPLLDSTANNDVDLCHGSLLDVDWSDGDLVFANSTCFSEQLVSQISERAERLKPGAFVITFTKPLTSPAFDIVEKKRWNMSWGAATVFIQRRSDMPQAQAQAQRAAVAARRAAARAVDAATGTGSQPGPVPRTPPLRPARPSLVTSAVPAHLASGTDGVAVSSPLGTALRRSKASLETSGISVSSPLGAALRRSKASQFHAQPSMTAVKEGSAAALPSHMERMEQTAQSSPMGAALLHAKQAQMAQSSPMGAALLRAKQASHSHPAPDDNDVSNVAAVSSPLGVALRRSKMQQKLRFIQRGSDEQDSGEITAVSSPMGSALRRSKVRHGQSPLRGGLPVRT